MAVSKHRIPLLYLLPGGSRPDERWETTVKKRRVSFGLVAIRSQGDRVMCWLNSMAMRLGDSFFAIHS
ncbi:hypothetical protein QC763_0005340 [Podospora pseudopauciseta]|uniref:Uncharacterized protein n=1 Tax=Podospora pseudopauciseta TaxID=2093780 RepID=A0ABR0HX84_9PEZI|nr:hypothetical protein QC763_0005340 [Podospora pseudopauciseta]